ncbi:MAG: hypothetical protein KDK04_02230 [Candidatus Competibacteraceae bacterium]|nr:hypothetical protein [Candidatus Competibacteraceae bacterium]
MPHPTYAFVVRLMTSQALVLHHSVRASSWYDAYRQCLEDCTGADMSIQSISVRCIVGG